MLFNSIDFIAFLFALTIIAWKTPQRFRWILLLISSCFLYASWNIISLISILYCSLLNHCFANLINNSKSNQNRKTYLIIDIILSLLPLFLIKYSGLFMQLLQSIYSLHVQYSPESMKWILPIGISFYTFQNLSYTIDVYRGNISSEKNIGLYLLYTSFFPLQLSGPIERASNLLIQLKSKIHIDYETIFSGCKLMLWGYFKKLVIADSLAVTVDPIFENPLNHSAYMLMLGSVFFSFQIYADFSGYVDIARGVAKLFGIELSLNFNYPYSSQSIKEFWHRWHITLSTWFRDYIYISLGGNKLNKVRWSISIIFVFTISGLWHGSGINYLAWGLTHALFYLIGVYTIEFRNKILSKILSENIIKIIRTLFTFILITIAWIFFKAETFSDALTILSKIVSRFFLLLTLRTTNEDIVLISNIINNYKILLNMLLLSLFIILNNKKNIGKFLSKDLENKTTIKDLLITDIMIILIVFLGSNNTREFIYMNY